MTRYFQEQVLRKWPYLTMTMCQIVVATSLRRERQPDGRTRLWGEVVLPDETTPRILRVVLLEDGATVHNAFLDRSYR